MKIKKEQEKNRIFQFRISEVTYERLKRKASSLGISPTMYTRNLIINDIKQDDGFDAFFENLKREQKTNLSDEEAMDIANEEIRKFKKVNKKW